MISMGNLPWFLFASFVLIRMTHCRGLQAYRIHEKRQQSSKFNLKDVIFAREETLQRCSSDFDCTKSQKCYSNSQFASGNLVLCDSTDSECACVDVDGMSCMMSLDCLVGARCIAMDSTKLCVPCDLVLSPSYTFVDEGNCNNEMRELQVSSVISKTTLTRTIESSRTDSTTQKISKRSFLSTTSGYEYGFTFDVCFTNQDCIAPRLCHFILPSGSDKNPRGCMSMELSCNCISFEKFLCENSSDCLQGDQCFQVGNNTACFACKFRQSSDFTPLDKGNCDESISPTASIEATASETVTASTHWTPEISFSVEQSMSYGSDEGFTYSSCSTDSDCIAPRICLVILNDTIRNCETQDSDCFCASNSHYFCQDSSYCLPGDRCYQDQNRPVCLSCSTVVSDDRQAVDEGNCKAPYSPWPSYISSNSPMISSNANNGKNVCIAVDALKGFAASSLIFTTHKRTFVLCDQHDSCATAGHMVIYKHVPMTMSSYCNMTGIKCVRRLKWVNSPRMKLGLRIMSNPKDLMFTALSASKGTKLEEQLLKSVIWMIGA